MGDVLPKLFGEMTEMGMDIAGPPMSLTHQFDIKTQMTDFTIAIPVKSGAAPAKLPTGATFGTVPSLRALRVEHIGAYHHLASAWAKAMAHQRHRKLKGRKNVPCIERYLSDPGETPVDELKTEILVPVR